MPCRHCLYDILSAYMWFIFGPCCMVRKMSTCGWHWSSVADLHSWPYCWLMTKRGGCCASCRKLGVASIFLYRRGISKGIMFAEWSTYDKAVAMIALSPFVKPKGRWGLLKLFNSYSTAIRGNLSRQLLPVSFGAFTVH